MLLRSVPSSFPLLGKESLPLEVPVELLFGFRFDVLQGKTDVAVDPLLQFPDHLLCIFFSHFLLLSLVYARSCMPGRAHCPILFRYNQYIPFLYTDYMPEKWSSACPD